MGHIFNLKSKYNLTIDIDKQIIMDGVDSRTQSSSFMSIDIKLLNENNKELQLTTQQKNDIIAVLANIRSIDGN